MSGLVNCWIGTGFGLLTPMPLLQLAFARTIDRAACRSGYSAVSTGCGRAQSAFLPDGLPENYRNASVWFRVLLPILGGVAIGLIFLRFSGGLYLLGVARVMERMSYHRVILPCVAFSCSLWAPPWLSSGGHSVGREGPHVYLGAASGSLLGQYRDYRITVSGLWWVVVRLPLSQRRSIHRWQE